MKKMIAAALCLLLMLPLFPAPAAGEGATIEGEYSGWIFSVEGGGESRLMSACSGVEALWPELGIYYADSLDRVNALSGGGTVRVEPNYRVYLDSSDTEEEVASNDWVLEAVSARSAWDWGLDGSGVRVGIIDSGIDADHEGLEGVSVAAGWNYLSDTGDVADDVDHGTFVAGVLAAREGAVEGVRGIAQGVTLVPLKCFSSTDVTAVSHIIRAVREAVDTFQCDVINMSFCMGSYSELLEEALDYAAEQGTVLVASAGNYGSRTKYYPAAFDCVIGVGSVDETLERSTFSQYNSSVHVTAPGGTMAGLAVGGGSRTDAGTSFSAPAVAALAALMLQADGTLTPAEISSLLATTSADLGDEGYDVYYGYGLARADGLLGGLAVLRPLTLTVEEGVLTLFGWGASAPTDLTVAAAYREDGKMLDCITPTGLPVLNEAWTLPEGTARVSFFALASDTLAPRQGGAEWPADPE